MGGSGTCSQLKLLLWKNWLVKKRQPIATVFEILIPVAAMFVLVAIRSLVSIDNIDGGSFLQYNVTMTQNLAAFPMALSCGALDFHYGGRVGYAPGPNTRQADADAAINYVKMRLVNSPGVSIGCAWNMTDFIEDTMFLPFPSEGAMEDYVTDSDYGDPNPPIDLGVIITAPSAAAHQWDIRFRTNYSNTPYTGGSINSFATSFDLGDWSKYIALGVVPMQMLLHQFIIAHDTGRPLSGPPLPSDITVAPYPMASFKKDIFGTIMSPVFGMFLVIAFMWPFSRIVRSLVEEKEMRLREGMKMMGLRGHVLRLSWALTYMLLFTVMCALCVSAVHFSVMSHTNGFLIFVFFMVFCLSLISGAMLVATFFSRAKTAGTLSFFGLLAAYLPSFAVSDPSRPSGAKVLASLLSPVAFSLGGSQILDYESAFLSLDFSNFGQVQSNYSLATSIGMMLFDSILYLFLGWYLDCVLPGEFGTAQPFYFLCLPSYWCGPSSKASRYGTRRDEPAYRLLEQPLIEDDGRKPSYGSRGSHSPSVMPSRPAPSPEADELYDQDLDESCQVEPVPADLRDHVGVSLRRLRKEFVSGDSCGACFSCSGHRDPESVNVALKGLSLDMYDGQIFVLLGHNGAGKTTTINMLTGMMAPSKGQALVGGRDITTEMDAIRQTTGVCPQHDILFPTLTVREHLEFFAILKGVDREAAPEAARVAIEEVQLEAAADQESRSLSGGQKRRLCLAISLIGDSRIVFLDEPTSGVDVFSRRAIWNLLARKKQGRVIILTTHFMDEADHLGDRIAILHKGMLRCCGSSLFLKRIYGVGYTMVLTRSFESDHKARPAAEEPPAQSAEQLVLSSVPQAQLISNVGTEIAFSLPLEASSVFPRLLRALDERGRDLGIANYGLSVTTLEEVFLKVAHEMDDPLTKQRAKERSDRMSTIARDRSASAAVLAESNQLHTVGINDAVPESAPLRPQRADSVVGQVLGSSRLDRGFWRDFRALLAKRWHILKRDRRSAVCQFFVPLVLLLLGLGLLRAQPSSFPTASFDAETQFSPPSWTAYNAHPTMPDLDAVMHNITSAEARIVGVAASSVADLSAYLLAHRYDHVPDWSYGSFYAGDLAAQSVWVLNNISALHGMPTFINLFDTALLRETTRDPAAKISSAVQPFPLTLRERSAVSGVFAAIVISLAMCFVPASFAAFIVKDKEQNSKHLQQISGVNMFAYWASNYFWDYVNFLIPALCSCVILLAMSNPAFTGGNFITILVVFLLYGLAVIPFTYACSFLFRSHSTAQNIMIMVYLTGGLVLMIVSFALSLVPSTKEANRLYIRHLFRLVPNFCLADTIFWMSARSIPPPMGQWDLNVSGYDIIFLIAEAVAYFGLTLLLEFASSIPMLAALINRDPVLPNAPSAEDSDVAEERQRIQSGRARDDTITLMGLRKTFPPNKVAVKDLWFSVPAGECFGFLGVNGAGKTTALKMLTGDIPPTNGTASLGGYSISTEVELVRRLMGYCPQFDALYEHLTGQEHLEFYGRIRGIPEDRLGRMVSYLIERLTLTEHAKRPAGTYSGGNKRKLSVAIALIGNPRVVFLDEPSTGMDPVSRRFMWDFIAETSVDRAVILTTHSMEECEALCQRIGILVLGELKCLGSSQHLKHKFGQGYQLDVSTADNSVEPARQFITSTFEGAQELECYGGNMKYKIPALRTSLATLFSLVEDNKAALGISEYSIGQTSLEQIFIHFAHQGGSIVD